MVRQRDWALKKQKKAAASRLKLRMLATSAATTIIC